MELLNAAQALQTQMSETYRELHRYPELSHQEVETSQRVARWLREIGLEVQAGRHRRTRRRWAAARDDGRTDDRPPS